MKSTSLDFSIAFGFLFFAACASVHTGAGPTPIPRERVYISDAKSEKNSAEVAIVRDPVPTGRICYFAIFIEKKLVARIGPNEKVVFNLEPGEKTISVQHDPNDEGICSSNETYRTEEKVTLAKEDKKSFRLIQLADGWPVLKSLSPPTPTATSTPLPSATPSQTPPASSH